MVGPRAPVPAQTRITIDIRISARKSIGRKEIQIDTVSDTWPVIREKLRPILDLEEFANKIQFDIDSGSDKVLIRPRVSASLAHNRELSNCEDAPSLLWR